MTQVIPEAIRELIERRARYQEWLAKLDDLGSEYRAEVMGRVREDYEGRLRDVEAGLQEHREELRASLEERKASLEELDRRHDSRSAELEEARLRHQVGEYDEEEWGRRRSGHEAELTELDGARDAERAAVGELAGVLTQVEGTARGAGAEQAPRVEATPEVEPAPAVRDAHGEEAEAEQGSGRDVVEPEAHHGIEPESPAEQEVAVEAVEAEDVNAEDVEGEEAELEEDVKLEEPAGGEAEVGTTAPPRPEPESAEVSGDDDFLDELEFLESLSLDDPDSFDAVSRMLEEETPPEEDDTHGGGG